MFSDLIIRSYIHNNNIGTYSMYICIVSIGECRSIYFVYIGLRVFNEIIIQLQYLRR